MSLVNCVSPVRIDVTTPEDDCPHYIYVGCGRCALCLRNKCNEWVFRLKATHAFSRDAFFITLTYAPEFLPQKGDNGRHNMQCFLKRLRFNYGLCANMGFKYYAITELGGLHGRLHHHALMFNTGMSWTPMLRCLIKTWPFGRVDVKAVCNERIHYCAKYCYQTRLRPKPKYYFINGKKIKQKQVNYFQAYNSHGIGLEYLTEQMRDYLRARGDGTTVFDGFVRALPRYLFEKLYADKEDPEYIRIKKLRLQHAKDSYLEERKIIATFSNQCSLAARAGYSPPPEPIEILERRERCRQVEKKAKKYRFVEPPITGE